VRRFLWVAAFIGSAALFGTGMGAFAAFMLFPSPFPHP